MASDKAEVLYFAYGSNLSPTQMKHRCPRSKPVALAHLPGWEWIINGRGYANIKPVSTSAAFADVTPNYDASVAADPGVYGVLYRLDPADEEMLDGFEGVPFAYEKHYLEVDKVKGEGPASGQKFEVLAYVDVKHVQESRPKPEYVERMNRAIDEAMKDWGLPKAYIDEVMRPFIPKP